MELKKEPQQAEETIHLSEYLQVLSRHKWLIFFSLFLIIALVAIHNSRLLPIYQASSVLIIDRESTSSPVTGQRTDYETYLSEQLTFQTHFELVSGRPVLEKVVRHLELDRKDNPFERGEALEPHPIREFFATIRKNLKRVTEFSGIVKKMSVVEADPELPEPDPMTDLTDTLRGMIEIEPVEETRLLKIKVTSIDPIMAQQVANAVAESYIEFNIDNRMKSSQTTLKWMTNQLYEVKKNLEDAEAKFQRFKRQERVVSIEDRKRTISQKIAEFNDAYLQTRNRKLELSAKLNELGRLKKSGKNIRHVRSIIDNPIISALYSKLVEDEVSLSRMVKIYKSKHPKIVQIKSDINEKKEKLKQEISKEIDSLRAERAVLAAKENVMEKNIADFEKEGMDVNQKELDHSILSRDVEMHQQLYDTLLVRVKEAGMAEKIDVSNLRITEPAVLPHTPIGPHKKRNLLLGIVLGLLMGVGLSFLWEYLDRSIRTEEDVRNYLGLPVLSIIPIAQQAMDKEYYRSRARSAQVNGEKE